MVNTSIAKICQAGIVINVKILPVTVTFLPACGSYLTGESGMFRYPVVPGTQYPHSVSCAWSITTTYGKVGYIFISLYRV